MKVLLVGNGGREHALAWRLSPVEGTEKSSVCVAGESGDCAGAHRTLPGDVNDLDGIEKFVRKNNGIDLVVIGPEEPLALGLADRILAIGVKVFGPTQAAAQIESDKWFAKEIMRQQAIPTAEARSFTDASAAEEYIKVGNVPCVVKAAGLAKGKGVTVCYRVADALETINLIMRKKAFGSAGGRVVIEELMKGPECSILAFVDRQNIYMLESSQDHKAVDDGDTGPMTGGMGAYSPTPVVTETMLRQIERDVLVPAIDGLLRDGIEYKGVLYAGLMLTTNGPKVLEFNCRFGDPEAQPLMMRLKSDLLEVMLAVADGTLDQIQLDWDPRPAICVVSTSRGYPGKYSTGLPITGVEKADALPGVKVFLGGTKFAEDGKAILTDGGRVLGVTAIAKTIADAQKLAYEAMGLIQFEGMHFRKDIGRQALP